MNKMKELNEMLMVKTAFIKRGGMVGTHAPPPPPPQPPVVMVSGEEWQQVAGKRRKAGPGRPVGSTKAAMTPGQTRLIARNTPLGTSSQAYTQAYNLPPYNLPPFLSTTLPVDNTIATSTPLTGWTTMRNPVSHTFNDRTGNPTIQLW